jgi:hypothetical protein
MSHGGIRLVDAANHVEIVVVETLDSHSPSPGDVRLSVSVKSDGFYGKYDQVWIGCDTWQTFVSSLRQVERDRAGHAAVESLSAEEFTLRIEIVKRTGRITASGWLSKYHHMRRSMRRAARSRIEFDLELDPSMLRTGADTFASPGPQ